MTKTFCKNFKSLNQDAVERNIIWKSFCLLSSDCWLNFFWSRLEIKPIFFWKRPQKQFSFFARIQVGSVCGYGTEILGWNNFFRKRKNLSDIICPKTFYIKGIQSAASFSITTIFSQHTYLLNFWEYWFEFPLSVTSSA